MQFFKLLRRITLYFVCALAYVIVAALLVAIAVSIKIFALKLAHHFVYPIFMFGDLLRGLELVDLLNILVFAIVGMGFGVATALLPSQESRKISASFLIILIPIILSIPQFVKYDLWIQDIANDDNIPKPEAKTIADSFLKRRINLDGVFGFYVYTGQFPMIPTRQVQMQELERLEKQVNSKFVKLSGIPPTVVNWLMGICFWGIRIFYVCVAVITAIAHYREGLRLVRR